VLTTQTLFGLGWSAYLLLPKFLATELGANALTIGYVSAVGGFAAVATIPFVTSLIDRVARRVLLQAGCVLLVLLSLGFLAADRVGPLLFLLQACTGAAFVLSFNASVTLVTDAAPASRLGQAIGMLGAVNMATNAVATLVAEHLSQSSGWPIVFELAALMGVLALAASFLVREQPLAPVSSSPTALTATPRPRGPVIVVLAVSALLAAPFSAMFTFHQPFALGLGATDLAAFFAGFTAAAVTVRVLFGTLGDRFGYRRVSIMAAAGYAAVPLATAWLRVEWLWVYGTAFGFAHGVLYPTLNALAVELAPARARGRVITLFNGAFNAGYGVSTLLWGLVAARYGYPQLFVSASLVGFGALLLLALQRVRRGQ
jgi:MFS family permease